jgi:hypothetical protein
MALGGFFGGETVIIDKLSSPLGEQTKTRHSPGVFAEFTSYGLLKKYIMDAFDIPTVTALFDNMGQLRGNNEKFDYPSFIILNTGGGVFRRFLLVY